MKCQAVKKRNYLVGLIEDYDKEFSCDSEGKLGLILKKALIDFDLAYLRREAINSPDIMKSIEKVIVEKEKEVGRLRLDILAKRKTLNDNKKG